MYWLSLAKVPSSIHNLTRQKLISFLWIASRAKEGVHLARWDTISIPMKFGRWDIKDIFWLGKALAMKRLWRGLTGKGLWSEIILDKYLKKQASDRTYNFQYLEWVDCDIPRLGFLVNVEGWKWSSSEVAGGPFYQWRRGF